MHIAAMTLSPDGRADAIVAGMLALQGGGANIDNRLNETDNATVCRRREDCSRSGHDFSA